jgi:hypothetical protein
LVLHANPSIVFTTDTQNYCGMSALDFCSAAVTSVPWDPGRKIVFHALAAFPTGSSPRLRSVSFGIQYDPTKFIMAAHGTCADLELPEATWPAPGTGTAQTWTNATQTAALTEAYWFCGYAYSEQEGEDSTSVSLIPHPVQRGVFVDDAVPAEADTIAAYGRLGLGTAGSRACPQSPPEGDSPGPETPGTPQYEELEQSADITLPSGGESVAAGRIWAEGHEIVVSQDQIRTGSAFDALWELRHSAAADTLLLAGYVYAIRPNGTHPSPRDYEEIRAVVRSILGLGQTLIFTHSGNLQGNWPSPLGACFEGAIREIRAGKNLDAIIRDAEPACPLGSYRWFFEDVARVASGEDGRR